MHLIVLNSSSVCNGYILKSASGECLLLEAGIKLLEVKKAVYFRLSDIAGCIVSHSHKDHSKKIGEYQQAGIPCYMNEDTHNHYFGYNHYHNIYTLKEHEQKAIGDFLVRPFLLEHDVPNFGYLIHHYESGLITFITDTHYCPYKFHGLNNILIEANYSEKIVDENLQTGDVNNFVRERVLTSHMGIETTKGFLKANDLQGVNNIILLHLSQSNSDARDFKKQITELTGKSVFIAKPGLIINLDKTSF